MLSTLYRLPGKSPFARTYALLSPSCLGHCYLLQLCLLCVISHIPLCCVLAVSVLEERVGASGASSSLWILFQFMCGLLATTINVYCIDQLTSLPEQRRLRWWRWWRWWQQRRPASARDSGYSSCGNNSPSSAAGWAREEMTNTPPVSAASLSDRAGTPHSDSDSDSDSDEADTPPQLTPTSSTGTSPDEPPSPADGFSPHGRQPPPAADRHPPTYQQATAMPLHSAHPALITIPAAAAAAAAASPRPPMVRRQAHTHLPTQRLLDPRSNSVRRSPLCLLLFFLAACTTPLIVSYCFLQLLGSSVYTHACSSYDWEVLLTAPPPASKMLPSADFTPRTAAPAHAFTMQMQMHPRNATADCQLLPPQQRLTQITYDTGMHSYRAVFVDADVAVVGGYVGMRFVELGLSGEGVWHDDLGFPRGVVESVRGDVVAAVHMPVGWVKRRSCEEVKVCVKGVETAVAAVVVGALLVETVEAAGRRLGGW